MYPDYYRMQKAMNDYSEAYRANGYSNTEIKKYGLYIKGRFNKKNF